MNEPSYKHTWQELVRETRKHWRLAAGAILLGLSLAVLLIIIWPSGNLPGSPREAATRYVQFIEKDHWRSACQLLEPSSRDQLEADTGRDCPDVLQNLYEASENIRIQWVRQKGNQAAAGASEEPSLIFLRRMQDGWTITFQPER